MTKAFGYCAGMMNFASEKALELWHIRWNADISVGMLLYQLEC